MIVCFGRTASGERFCFDFRGKLHEPNIIFWNDGYWRGVASDFSSFIGLFEPFGEYEIQDLEPGDGTEEPSGTQSLLGLFEPHQREEWFQKLHGLERRRFDEEVRKWREDEPPST